MKAKVTSALRYIHSFGLAYEAWSGLVVVATVLAAAYKKIPDGSSGRLIVFNAALAVGALAIISAPVLFVKLRNISPKPRVSNPTLAIKETSEEIEIADRKYSIDSHVRIAALAPTSIYNFSLSLTGTATAKLTLESNGELIGPTWRHSQQCYQVRFEHELKEEQEQTIHLRFEIDDPDSNMRPFIGERMNKAAEHGKLKKVITFKGLTPTNVLSEELDGGAQEPIDGTLRRLSSIGRNTYVYEVPKTITGRVYTVSWQAA
jgi:hypothetical protein